MSRESRRQRKKCQQALPAIQNECHENQSFHYTEEQPVSSFPNCPPPEPQSSENNSPSPEFYMKRIRKFSRLANVFNHLALWIFIICVVGTPVAYAVNSDLFPGDSGFYVFGLGIIIPGLLAIANRLTADFVMVNIRNYCFTIYPYEHQKEERIEEIQQLTLEYIGMVSSQFLGSLFNRR